MLLGVVIGVLGKKLVHDDIVTVVGVLISLVGMFLVVYKYLAPKRNLGTESSSKGLSRSEPARYLPNGSNIEYIPSVTEVQTDLLQNSAVRLGQKNNDEAERATKKMEQP